MTTKALKIAYFYISFPKVTETFNLREMHYLQQHGFQIDVFSLLKPKASQVIHKDCHYFLNNTHYGAWFFSKDLWIAQGYYLIKAPKAYLTTLWQLVRHGIKQPAVLVKTLGIFPKSVLFARTLEKQGGCHHLHATFASHNTTAALIVSVLTKIPFSFTIDAYDLYIETALLEFKLKQAAFSTTISEFNLAEIQKRYAERVKLPHVIRRGIDLQRFKPIANKKQRKADEPFILVCVASLQEKKGHRFLIEALALLKQENIAVHCVIIGDGVMRTRLEEQVNKLGLQYAVEFKGAQPEEQVIKAFQKAHCAVLPSIITKDNRMEGIPNVLMEAMACQLPVIGTKISGLAELIDDGVNGILVEQQNSQALADAIIFIKHHPEEAMKFGLEARHKIEKNFNMQLNPALLAKLYKEALN